MADNFAGRAEGIEAPARGGFAITANDNTDLVRETRAIYVGASGDLAVTMADGTQVVLGGIAAGSLLPLRLGRVKATNTTAGDLVGFY